MGRRDGSLRSTSRTNRFDVFGSGMSSSLSEGGPHAAAHKFTIVSMHARFKGFCAAHNSELQAMTPRQKSADPAMQFR
jgi:hypothetical protein